MTLAALQLVAEPVLVMLVLLLLLLLVLLLLLLRRLQVLLLLVVVLVGVRLVHLQIQKCIQKINTYRIKYIFPSHHTPSL